MSEAYKLNLAGLKQIYEHLQTLGKVIAPQVVGEVIQYVESNNFDLLPQGWREVQGPGIYRLQKTGTKSIFSYQVAPTSWKTFLYPPKELIFTATKKKGAVTITPAAQDLETRVLFGVRPCELRAIRAQENVFQKADFSPYQQRLDRSFILAVSCVLPGENCFCSDLASGPDVQDDCDLKLVEWGDEPKYLLEAKSKRGEDVLQHFNFEPMNLDDTKEVEQALLLATKSMGRSFDAAKSKDLLANEYEHPAFKEVAQRCTSCGNCTLVCPTCFCSNLEDHTSLDGSQAQRYRTWDSCFTLDFTYIHGGYAREKTSERYRQWLTHKLSNWDQQFGQAGCVGCGRCITWCPEGIDLTIEFKRLLEEKKASPITYKELT